jgi:hypothetical protein
MKLKHLAILTVLFPLVATAEISGGYFAVIVDNATAARPEGYIEGPFKVGMLVSDIGALLNTLPAGVERPELIHDEHNALLMIQLRDPDNYIVQVIQLIAE